MIITGNRTDKNVQSNCLAGHSIKQTSVARFPLSYDEFPAGLHPLLSSDESPMTKMISKFDK